MKRKLIIIIIALVGLCLFVFIKIDGYINELTEQIDNKNELINSLSRSDSLVEQRTKEYSETIKKYINDCGVMVGEKRYSLNEFIELYAREYKLRNDVQDSLKKLNAIHKFLVDKYGTSYTLKRKNDTLYELKNEPSKADSALAYFESLKELEDSSSKLSDSVFIYKTLLSNLESRLKVKPNYTYDGETIKYSFYGLGTIDSALALFPYYKHRLSSDGDTWTIDVDNKYLRIERKKEREERKSK